MKRPAPASPDLIHEPGASASFALRREVFRCATGLSLKWHPEMAPPQAVPAATVLEPESARVGYCLHTCMNCRSLRDRFSLAPAARITLDCPSFAWLSSQVTELNVRGSLLGYIGVADIAHPLPDKETFRKFMVTASKQGLTDTEMEWFHRCYALKSAGNPEWFPAAAEAIKAIAESLTKYAGVWYACSPRRKRCFERAEQYIDEHIATGVNRSSIATHVGMSNDRLYALFRQVTGMPLMSYIIRRRVEQFKVELLASNQVRLAIAVRCGWKTLSQFNRSFVKFTGKSPRRFFQEELARMIITGSRDL